MPLRGSCGTRPSVRTRSPVTRQTRSHAARTVEPLQRPQQAKDPFLEQIGRLQSLRLVAARCRVDERQQPPDQLLPRRVIAGLGTAGKSVCFVAGDRLRGLGLIPQFLCGGVAALSFGASGQLPLHGHAPIVPHGCAAADAPCGQLALLQLNRVSGGRSRQLVCRQIGHSGGSRRMTTP